MIYVALLKNQWKSFARSLRRRRLWLLCLGLLPVVAYVGVVLAGVAIFFEEIFQVGPGEEAVTLLNENLLAVLMGLFALRFFFQRPPRMEIRPYLHLPIDHRHLVRYFQAASLFSVHNVYPLVFFLPFWTKHVGGGPYATAEAAIWLGGVYLCVLFSHFLNTYVRIVLDRHTAKFLILVAVLAFLQILDHMLGTGVVTDASLLVFDRMARGSYPLLLLVASLAAATYVLSTEVLLASLKAERSSVHPRNRLLPSALAFGRSPVLNLIFLELKMMWRNKRARQYVVISLGVSTAYTAVLLSDFNAFEGSFMAALVGLFASGVFALNYGQLMFAWESHYFDGLMTRDVQPQQIVLAKFMVLEGSCLVLFLISLPLFFWLAPELLLLHVAFLFYNAGVTSMLMVGLAIYNRKRVNGSEGSFFNYQGFSVLHWLWIVPTVLPPGILLFALEQAANTALSLIALLGLVNMLLAWPWSKLLARLLARRKHQMALGFRSMSV